MAFTFYNPPILTPEQANPFHAAFKSAMEGYGDIMRNKYLPRTLEADIFSKEASPLATIASNPLLFAMMPPEQRENISRAIGQLMQGITGNLGGQQQAQPSVMSRISDNISRLFGGGEQTQQPQMTQQATDTANLPGQQIGTPSPENNPLLPQAGKGLADAAGAKIVSPYNVTPYKPGDLITDPKTGETISAPSEQTITRSQQGLSAIEKLAPQLKRIADDADKFLKPGSSRDIALSSGANVLIKHGLLSPETAKGFHIDPDLASANAKWHGDINVAVDSLMAAFPQLPQTKGSFETIAHVLEPKPSEDSAGYQKRINQLLNQLQSEQVPLLKKQLSKGFELSPDTVQITPEGFKFSSNLQKNVANNLLNSKSAKNEGIASYNIKNSQLPEGVVQARAVLNDVPHVKINGKWYATG